MKLTKFLLLQVLKLVYWLESVCGGGVCPQNTGISNRYYGSRCFSLISTESTWMDANAFCSNSSGFGRLVTADSDNLNAVIKWFFPTAADVSSGKQTPFWIGGYIPELMNSSSPFHPEILKSATWFWRNYYLPYISEKEIAIKRWSDGQPENGNGCCLASSQEYWYARDCKSKAKFVCEYTCTTYIKASKNVVTFQSDSFPYAYPEGTECEWFIEVTEGQVQLQFESFSIDSSPFCMSTYVLIKELKNSTDVLGRYCGRTVPKLVLSPSNRMYVYFASGPSTSFENKGFKARIESTAGPIVKQLTGQGIVTSPNFPLNYFDNSVNIWQLSVNHGPIILKFTDFDIQPGTGGNCSNDRLIVREMSIEAKVLGIYCGSNIPSNITSLTGGLTLQMITDDMISSAGFRAIFWSGQDSCVQVITATKGTISSPGYPKTNPPSQCSWYIDVVDGVARMEFTDFELAYSSSCIDDGLQVYDGYTQNSVRIGSGEGFCSYMKPPRSMKASSRYLTILYRSSGQTIQKGFNMTFFSSNECSKKIQQNAGTISSIDYPLEYDPYSNCTWAIDVINGTALFQLNNLDLEPSINCTNERLEIYDGNSTGARLISSLCTSPPPFSLNATSQYIFIRMITGNKVTRSGFTGRFWSSELSCPNLKAAEFLSNTLRWNNNCYGISTASFSATDGRDFCELRGMDPVSIETREEMQALFGWLKEANLNSDIWTGAYRTRSNSTSWFWYKRDRDIPMRDGLKSSLWRSGFPKTAMNAYIKNGALEDAYYWNWRSVICEMPEFRPTTISVKASENCSPPPKIISGTYESFSSSYASGATIKYRCDEGFRVVGDDTLRCLDGLWLNKVPFCSPNPDAQPLGCSGLPKLQNGSYKPKYMRYISGSTINVVCAEGYKVLGQSNMTCVNGQWKDKVPMCVKELDGVGESSKDGDSFRKNKTAGNFSYGAILKPNTGAMLESKGVPEHQTVTLAVTLSIIGLLVIIIIVGVVSFLMYKKGLNPFRTLDETQ